MRKSDKSKNLIKANILAENRYLESKGLLPEGNNLGNVLYHGTNHKIDLNSLDMGRTSLARDKQGRVAMAETASDTDGTGLYVTPDLWMYEYDNTSDSVAYLNPVYKEGNTGTESAEKYAYKGDSDKKYIYRVVLSDDINLKKYGDIHDARNIRSDDRDKYLSEGIDGFNNGNEAVILNKDKIKSFELAYEGRGNSFAFHLVDSQKEGMSWSKAQRKPSREFTPFISPVYVVREEDVKEKLTELMGGPYVDIEEGSEHEHWYANMDESKKQDFFDSFDVEIPAGTYDGVNSPTWENHSNKLFPIKNYKVIKVGGWGTTNWRKVG